MSKNREGAQAWSVYARVLVAQSFARPGCLSYHTKGWDFMSVALEINRARPEAAPLAHSPSVLGSSVWGAIGLTGAAALAAVFVPKSFGLALFGDFFQVALIAAAAIFAFRNFLQSRSRTRIFWVLILIGSFLWTVSNAIWAIYEVLLARPVPDLPIVDILLFLKVVPLTAAIIIAPNRGEEPHFRAFGLLDVFVLMVFSLYLFAFGVFAYRLLPGAADTYNFYFNLADAVGNQTLVIATGVAALRAKAQWRSVFRLYFVAAALYALASDLSNVAIDAGHYYTGSLYDVPLIASLSLFACMALAGRDTTEDQDAASTSSAARPSSSSTTFFAEHLAMLVALTTPVIGIWLLSSAAAPPQLRSFRIAITLLTIFILTLLLSIKEDILAAGLFASLQNLSDTYSSIDRFKNHLTQSEKLASLGELVARVANQIKVCMAAILESSSRLTSRPDLDARIQNMAGKIGQYAQRTDVLVENMLHFAQETPLRLAPLDVKPLLDSALHLSRVGKLPNIRVDVIHEQECPQARGDSSQILLVFLQLISNAVDALAEAQGGALTISLRASGPHVILEFADSGPGIQEPQRVFEPFYTTKPVGKGTGLGLSTCYGIMQQHGGEISCYNRPEGGAVFTIAIPIAQQPNLETAPSPETLLAEGVR